MQALRLPALARLGYVALMGSTSMCAIRRIDFAQIEPAGAPARINQTLSNYGYTSGFVVSPFSRISS